MDILFTIIHVLACLVLVIVVLLQKGKGADLAGAFGGGGSAQALGVRSATQFIHKLTIAAAVFFMLTSWTLGFIYSGSDSLAVGIEKAGAEQSSTDEAKPAEEVKTEENDAATKPEAEAETPAPATEEEVKPADESNPPAAEENK